MNQKDGSIKKHPFSGALVAISFITYFPKINKKYT
jgi:hypothetical protein